MQSQSWVATLVFALIAFAGGYFAGSYGPPSVSGGQGVTTATPRDAACYFSPRGGCTQAIISEIGTAQHSIELEGYCFTSRPIGDALLAARRRGVNVTLVLDAAQTSEHRQEARELTRAGVLVYLDASHAVSRNQVILIDNLTVIAGSFDFIAAADETNAENILILRNHSQLQSAYQDNFLGHLKHSQAFDGS